MLLTDTKRANTMLREALQELINDEQMAKEALKNAKETYI
jgi:hypothetical protein